MYLLISFRGCEACRCLQAMFVDFGYAESVGGECMLRFDDTNPEAEKQEYIDHIQDIVGWMGYKPSKAGCRPALHVPVLWVGLCICLCLCVYRILCTTWHQE